MPKAWNEDMYLNPVIAMISTKVAYEPSSGTSLTDFHEMMCSDPKTHFKNSLRIHSLWKTVHCKFNKIVDNTEKSLFQIKAKW